jgi:L-glutamine---4-(methylsulfanyl)-2-oxobutanoate aminotransferase
VGEPTRLELVHRHRGLDAPPLVPHAEPDVRIVVEVLRHAQSLSRVSRMRPEELDELATQGSGTPRAEAKTLLDAAPAVRARLHGRSLPYAAPMREAPDRFRRLPEQYFTGLLARVAAAAAEAGEPLVDLGRGNPEVGPPSHVVEALQRSAARPDVHGYAPFAGLPVLKEAIAARYRDVYGVELDPLREVAVVPGSKTALMEFALVAVERGETILLPDPGYADYPSAVALAGARRGSFVDFESARGAALYLNYPSNPTAGCAPEGLFEQAVHWAERTGAWVLHDFAYGDLVFDRRAPRSFLTVEGARDVGVELFSMSKTYGMAGWRLGFVLGNAELVSRIEELQDHVFAGIFRPLQEAGVAALTGPQDSVEVRRATYERRRDRALGALDGVDAQSEGTFFVWFRLPDGVGVERLLLEHRVAVAPGEGFGDRGRGWARLSLAVTDEILAEGLDRLRAALA